MDDFVAPVKVLLKALDAGIKLSARVSESAGSASTAKALQISGSAPGLQRSLERNAQAIRDAYRQTVEACGERFSQALIDDKAIANRLKELKNEVRDKIDDCQDFEDEPDSFDPAAFISIQKEAQNSYAECVSIFNRVRSQILEARKSSPVDTPKDDRAFLTSMRTQEQVPPRKPVPFTTQQSQPAPDVPVPVHVHNVGLEPPPVEPPKPKSPWAINGPSQFDIGPSTSSSRRQPSRDLSPTSLPSPSNEVPPHYVAKEVVRYRISANDEFLERRRQSRVMFQNELQRQSMSRSSSGRSVTRPTTSERRISGAIDENRVSEVFTDGPLITSPQLGNATLASSPLDARQSRSGSNGYDAMVSRQRSSGQNSPDARHSRSSSLLHDGSAQRQELHRNNSSTSQDSIFGLRAANRSLTAPQIPTAPLSPPLSENGRLNGSSIENLAVSLRTPAFGEGVYEGMELVDNNKIDYSSEKMVVVTNDLPPNHPYHNTQATPTASVRSIDCPMPINNSFFIAKGFCPGAEAYVRGEHWYKIVKRPAGHYSATVSAKCNGCAFEVGWNDMERERMLDKSGIFMNSGIRWRQRFIAKSHIRTNTTDSSNFACIFCVEENKTVEPHDATVFFSVQQLFRHLAKHPQPLPKVAGFKVLYGVQPLSAIDFDIHLTTPIPKFPEFSITEIQQKVATRPSANALVTHHPKASSNSFRDPDRNPVMHFAHGAKIVGITFPDRFKGEWAHGYHDGEKGCFPSDTIQLEMPVAEDMIRNPKSTLLSTARWSFKPSKEAQEQGWLKFSKGDRITCIGYTFMDQWCWSGQNSKGKWGIFPKAFVEQPQDGTALGLAMSPGTVKHSRFGSKMSSFSLGRKSSTQDRPGTAMSIRSASSAGSVGVIHEGLEVASSPSQQVRTIGSWKI